MQNMLHADQVIAFYHDDFVLQQVEHFKKIAWKTMREGNVVVDVGGGCGFFSNAISKELNVLTRVIDIDPVSVEAAKSLGVNAIVADAFKPVMHGDENIVCFNLILHHLVGRNEKTTIELQKKAISVWRSDGIKIFINEYIYESWFGGYSGWLIFHVTKSKLLSSLANVIAKVFPSLHANTFGVGVRFRCNNEWRKIFLSSGFKVIEEIKGDDEYISLPRRLLLIKAIRRNSFLIAPL
jgi:hypothetical protein